LQDAYSLSTFDLEVILIALAPEIDLRYERLYAYLQDDVTRKRPTVDLALNLLCSSVDAKLTRRSHFAPDAPLVFHRLIQLIADPNHVQPPLLAHYIKLDDQIFRLLVEQDTLDPRLAPFCRMIEPAISFDDVFINEDIKRVLPGVARQARDTRQPLRLYFHGASGLEQSHTVEALAGELGMRALAVDFAHLLAASIDFSHIFPLLFREAWFQDAILSVDNFDALYGEERNLQYLRFLDALREDTGITILAGARTWMPSPRKATGVITITFSLPEFHERRACWEANLLSEEIRLQEDDLDALANRFRLTPNQIADAVATGRSYALWRASEHAVDDVSIASRLTATLGDFFAAARAQCGHNLAKLTQQIGCRYTWNDIVVPEDVLAQLCEICRRVEHSHRVLEQWGFGRKLSLGKGLSALFAGPSGTGKTMAAEIIANELGLDLYKIDLSGVVSKYIGETEKNLDRIFTAAENANAILFFDEADALFGKRSEVRDSHDRYANVEISYLLQKVEQYEGVAILATNLRGNLDEAFTRRLAFAVHFPFPDEASRRRIWAGIWPIETPLADDIDLDTLAQQFKLSGGNIKNIALAAAFLAAAENRHVAMVHVLQAIRREYQKMGKVLAEAELNGPEKVASPSDRGSVSQRTRRSNHG
jgi:AAA+ superfamily predicted ATPase